jgi:hypothetical protein
MMPEEDAPRPVPDVQPYFFMRRVAKFAWPGRDVCGGAPLSEDDIRGGEYVSASFSASGGGGGSVYRMGAAEIVLLSFGRPGGRASGSGAGGGAGGDCGGGAKL